MDVERVSGTPPEGAAEKEKSAPNAKAFREEVERIEKVPESEFEGRQRKKRRSPEDTEEEGLPAAARKRFLAQPPIKGAPSIVTSGKGKAFQAPSRKEKTPSDLPTSPDFFGDLEPDSEEYPIVSEEKAKEEALLKKKMQLEEKALLPKAKEGLKKIKEETTLKASPLSPITKEEIQALAAKELEKAIKTKELLKAPISIEKIQVDAKKIIEKAKKAKGLLKPPITKEEIQTYTEKYIEEAKKSGLPILAPKEEKATLKEVKPKAKPLIKEKAAAQKAAPITDEEIQAYTEKRVEEEKKALPTSIKAKQPTAEKITEKKMKPPIKEEAKLTPSKKEPPLKTPIEKPIFPSKVAKEKEKIEEKITKPVKEKEAPSPLIKEKRKREEKKELSQISWKQIPYHITMRALEASRVLPSYISNPDALSELQPLYTRMVGTLIHMTNEGVTRTEVLLTASSFASSVFYGSKVVFEKFASAPDSFNIRLIGTPQAVSLFNDNLDGLMQAFKTGYEEKKFAFRIGRIYTEQEKLVSKKQKIGKEKGEKQR